MMNKNEALILIVDDSSDYRDMLKIILSQDYPNLFFATNGEEAYKVLTQNHINLVISDFHMPGTGGEWLLKRIHIQALKVPVIIVSGSVFINENEILNLGARALIKKPFLIKSLLTSIAEHLPKHPAS